MIPVNDNSGVIADLSANPCILVPCGDMMLALPIMQVDDVFNVPPITPVPLAPRHIAGLLNLRGKIVTAICLAERLGVPVAPEARPTLVIGVTHAHESFGFLVHAVGEVVPLPAGGRGPVPHHIAAGWTACAKGMHQTAAGLVIELDVAALLTLRSDAA